MRDRSLSRVPWLVWGFVMVLLVPTLVISLRNGSLSQDAFIYFAIPMILGYSTVGALVASRQPRNAVGWLMLLMGSSFLLAGFTDEYVIYTYITEPGALPFGVAAAWLTNWAFFLMTGSLPLVLSLFPTGHVHSPRWRFLPRLVVALTAALILAQILSPGRTDARPAIENPTGVQALGTAADVVLFSATWLLLATGVASVVALILRYRRSRGDERQQLRWFVSAVLVGLVLLVVAFATVSLAGEGVLSEVMFFAFLAVLGVGLPASVGVAVLRYRLYDLDVVIRKTLVGTVVVVVLTGLYLGVLALATLGNVSRVLVGALLLAITFNPVRRAARALADRVAYGRRATPYEVLASFSERMSETYSTEDVLPRMAQVLRGATGAARAIVWLRVGDELHRAAWAGEHADDDVVRPVRDELPDLPADIAAEVRHQGDLLGALAVTMPANDPADPSRERLVRDLAAQAGPVLRNVRLIEELRTSRRRIVAAQDERAKALERNIHDGAQQQLVAMSVKLRLAKQLVGKDQAKAETMLTELETETTDAIENLRDLARGIYPPLLADKGLAAALEAQARKSPLPVTVGSDGIGRYPQEVEAAVYFCCLEALSNVAKYAEASRVEILLRIGGRTLEFQVTDDGRGFDLADPRQGTGLQGMADRLDAIGGALEVRTAPGAGTTVVGSVPAEAGELAT